MNRIFSCLGLATMLGVGALVASAAADAQGTVPYSLHWAVKTSGGVEARGGDFAGKIDVPEVAFQRDVVVFWEHELGVFPREGPQQFKREPGYLDAHRAKIRRDLDRAIPDRSYGGMVILDFESWDPSWARTRSIFREEWEQYMRSVDAARLASMPASARDTVLRDTYEAAAREFFLASLAEVRTARPRAKIAFYGYPRKHYHAARETGRGVIGYGDGQYEASRINDRLEWLWQAEDFIAPGVYTHRRTVDAPERGVRETNSVEDDRTYLLSNLREAVRVAKGKPVYQCAWIYYQDGRKREERELLNRLNVRSQLRVPREAGAAGVIFGGGVPSEEAAVEVSQWIRDVVMPEVRAMGLNRAR